MSVLSVEPLALGGPGEIGAERAQRPGSRRLGGVEATGASVATADSWPDRRKGWASPEWGPALRLAVMGGIGPGRGALTSPVPQIAPWGRRLLWYRRKSTASTTGFYIPGRRGAPLAGVSRSTPHQYHVETYCRRAGPRVGNLRRTAPTTPVIPPDAPRRLVARTAPTREVTSLGLQRPRTGRRDLPCRCSS